MDVVLDLYLAAQLVEKDAFQPAAETVSLIPAKYANSLQHQAHNLKPAHQEAELRQEPALHHANGQVFGILLDALQPTLAAMDR